MYLWKNEIKCAKIFDMFTAVLGVSIMSRAQVQLQYNRFKEGQEDVNDNAHPGLKSSKENLLWIIS